MRASKNNKNPVVFCGIQCFRAYLDKNRPNIAIFEPRQTAELSQRIHLRRLELEQELQFLPQNSLEYFLKEELFFELHSLIENRREVTSHIAKPIQVMEV